VSELAERLKQRYFGSWVHPYETFESEVQRVLRKDSVLLDAGCGRTAPVLRRYRDKASRLIGIDVVDSTGPIPGVEYFRRSLTNTELPSETVDVIMARSVMEHVDEPQTVYAEFARVLKPGGRLVFLTANLWDYASLIAATIPNRFHGWIVAKTEGRAEEDTFPVRYRTNTKRAIRRFAAGAGLQIDSLRYLGQYPNYFMFNGALFFVATGYEKLIASTPSLHWLRGWILCTLVKR